MKIELFNDFEIQQKYWNINAKPWIKAIDNNEIESRMLVTIIAIINTILEHKAQHLLDIGCGEGWLARELAVHGIRGIGN